MPRAKKTNRGGTRTGTPGKAYPNRSDLHQPVRVPTGRPYGERKAAETAQKIIPLPRVAPAPGPGPGEVPGLAAPTTRPAEPVTAGVPIGAGPDDNETRIRAAYRRYPTPALAQVLANLAPSRDLPVPANDWWQDPPPSATLDDGAAATWAATIQALRNQQ